MSLIRCPACGASVSKEATACPSCGHPLKKQAKSYGCGTLLAIGFAVFALVSLLSTCQSSSERSSSPAGASQAGSIVPPSAEQVAAAQEKTRQEAERIAAERAAAWLYDQSQDAMSSRTVYSAVIRSRNEFELGFPYRGPQRGTIHLRKHPQHGTDVIISIERGQILCRINSCRHEVRFDEGSIQPWTMLEPESNQSEILFVRDAESFISKLRQAKLVRVQLDLYDQNPVTLEFDVSQFDNDRWQGRNATQNPVAPTQSDSQGRS